MQPRESKFEKESSLGKNNYNLLQDISILPSMNTSI